MLREERRKERKKLRVDVVMLLECMKRRVSIDENIVRAGENERQLNAISDENICNFSINWINFFLSTKLFKIAIVNNREMSADGNNFIDETFYEDSKFFYLTKDKFFTLRNNFSNSWDMSTVRVIAAHDKLCHVQPMTSQAKLILLIAKLVCVALSACTSPPCVSRSFIPIHSFDAPTHANRLKNQSMKFRSTFSLAPTPTHQMTFKSDCYGMFSRSY